MTAPSRSTTCSLRAPSCGGARSSASVSIPPSAPSPSGASDRIGEADVSRRKQTNLVEDPLWYKDAVIYQLHVKSFFDANDDGVGDLAGLLAKLDYVAELGVNCIWLLPFYPSPRRDDGYDIADYRGVHPEYGRIADFKRFVEAAHARGIRVITELVINHTSDQHPWFQKARKAKPGSAARDFYVWSDTDKRYSGTRIIFLDTEKSNWSWDEEAQAYYWHRFYSHQPDLNFDNPRVLKEVLSVMRYWLDMGVDGLRLDAVPYLVEREGTNNENLPETHDILKQIRAEVDRLYPDRLLLAEANQWPEDTQDYFGDGDECHMAFHFPLMPRMYMAIAQEDRYPITDIMRQTPEIPDTCQWAIFLRNHDELTLEMVTDKERDYLWNTYAADKRARINLGIRRRLAPLMERDRRRIELMNALLFSMPGTPVIYYGDEIGMGDNIYLGDRDGVRTPMQWSSDRNGGFSRADPARLALPVLMDPLYGYDRVNVESQQRDPNSLLNWMRRKLAVRGRHSAFGRGTIRFLRPANRKVLAYLREHEDERILCVANLSRQAQAVELNLTEFAGCTPVEMSGGAAFPGIGQLPYLLTLPPYGFYWFALSANVEPPGWSTATSGLDAEQVTFVLRHGVADVLARGERERSRETLERDVLPGYLAHRRWFQGKDADVASTRIESAFALPDGAGESLVAFVDVETAAGTERYALPLAVSWDDEPSPPFAPQLALARVRQGRRVGHLTDGFATPAFTRAILDELRKGTRRPFEGGEIVCEPTDVLAGINMPEDPEVEWLTTEQSNSTAIVGRSAVVKLLRRLTTGVHPEAEMCRFLTRAGFDGSPPLLGEVRRVGPDGEPTTLAISQGYVSNQGDGWEWTLRYLERSIDELASMPDDEAEAAEGLFDAYALFASAIGWRLAEMHSALASVDASADPGFAPETATKSDAQALRDKVAAEVEGALAIIEGRDWAPMGLADEASSILQLRDPLTEFIARESEGLVGRRLTRIHGDLHLGQTLVAGSDIRFIDFEGEPSKPLDQRRAKATPLRDVAGMVRSFDYAAATVARGRHAPWGPAAEMRIARLRELFHAQSEGAFLQAYGESAPEPFGDPGLLDLLILEKAAYEVRYEAANRPGWLDVPVQGFAEIVRRLVGGDGEGG
ncbi:MAG: maltose alpha-D-glucosyltransferase [Salinarimonadaceae bacterium]|nr:MAG: maltose alpha-D-glucosyltransferase [Salinarimonadaceae bacterium]